MPPPSFPSRPPTDRSAVGVSKVGRAALAHRTTSLGLALGEDRFVDSSALNISESPLEQLSLSLSLASLFSFSLIFLSLPGDDLGASLCWASQPVSEAPFSPTGPRIKMSV